MPLALAVGATGRDIHCVTCVEEAVESLDGVAVVQTCGWDRVAGQRTGVLFVKSAVEEYRGEFRDGVEQVLVAALRVIGEARQRPALRLRIAFNGEELRRVEQ